MTNRPSRQEQRERLKEGRKVFEAALRRAEEVERGMRGTTNLLPWWRRIAIALRIIRGIW